jgi:hypothetical protein
MTPTRIDSLLTDDLEALGADSRREPPPLDAALRSTGVYRDDRAGAEARRNALADERRVQLALMPLSLSHVYAHRVGRAAAGAMAMLCAAKLLVLVADPMVLRAVQWFLPGINLNLGLCAALCAAAILLAYVVGNWIAEWHFGRKMRQAIETRGDVFNDLDRLARGPIDVGHALVRRVDGWSIGLAIAGVAALVSIFAYVFVVAAVFRPPSFVFSSSAVFSEPTATTNLGPVVYGLLIALGAAIAIARGCVREHRLPGAASPVRWFEHWLVLPIAFVGGIVTLYMVFRMVHRLDTRHVMPSQEMRFGLAIAGELTLLAFTTWGALWWRRIERKRIGER